MAQASQLMGGSSDEERIRVEDFFDDGDDYEYILEQAEERARSVRELEFLQDLQTKWKAYGMRAFLSENQYKWLKKLGGYE